MNRITLQSGLAMVVAGCALALPMAAAAEETKVLYKCVDAKGTVSIQAKSCAPGSTEAWHRDAQTEPKQTPQEAQAARDREAVHRKEVEQLSVEVQKKIAEQQLPATPPPATRDAPDAPEIQAVATDQCRAAQGFLSAVREKTWIGLTDDQTKRIMNWTMDQCRVNTTPNQ